MTQDKPRRRTFTVERPKDASVDFTLEYSVRNLEQPDDTAEDAWLPDTASSVIHCVRRAPGNLLLEVLAAGDGAEQFAVIDRFLSSAIIPADLPEYKRIVNDPDVAVPIETLADITAWLVEVYAARPTEPPSA